MDPDYPADGETMSEMAAPRHVAQSRVAWIDTDAGGRIHFTAAFRWAEAGGDGFQVQTPTADDPVYVALSGTNANPAIPGTTPASVPTCTSRTARRTTTRTP